MDSIEKVYYIGENSWETVRVDIPENFRTMYILNNSELVIEYESQSGVSQAVFFSDINITAPYTVGSIGLFSSDPHAGLNIIRIISRGNHVLINETR